MISLLVCSRISGNDNSALLDFLESLTDMSFSGENFEVLIKFDSDDKKVKKVLPTLHTYPFKVKYIIEPRGRGYTDLHIFYNQLFPYIDERTTVIGAMADDFMIVKRGWDELVLNQVGEFPDGVFVLHGRPHPPMSRVDFFYQKFCLDFDVNDLENIHPIDEAPFWGRKLVEVCKGFGGVSFTDAWTLALEHTLFHNHNINRTLFLEEPIIYRKTSDEIDQPIGSRWWTDRADNFAITRSKDFQVSVKQQAIDIYQFLATNVV